MLDITRPSGFRSRSLKRSLGSARGPQGRRGSSTRRGASANELYGTSRRAFVIESPRSLRRRAASTWRPCATRTIALFRGWRLSPATKVLVLGQCSAGSFGSLNLGRAIVCSACGPGEDSFPCYVAGRGEEPLYNEFLYQMAGALAGQYPDGQSLLDPGLTPPPAITLDEAFRYARDHDRWVTGTRGAAELPRMFDPHGIATTMTL